MVAESSVRLPTQRGISVCCGIGGTRVIPNAALAVQRALRGGAGLVTGHPRTAYRWQCKLTEAMTYPAPGVSGGFSSRCRGLSNDFR